MTRRHVRSGSDEWTADVEGEAVTLSGGDGGFAITNGPDDTVRVADGVGQTTAETARSGDVVWVGIDGQAFEFHVADRERRPRGSATKGHESLTPPMAATVVRILVKTGDRVHAGDPLIVLEAMKMELPIRAGHEATVGAIHCREGELVQPEQPLIDLVDGPPGGARP
jgi:biotin carboxyl carrier protein